MSNRGIPVGVCEVKRPGKHIMNSPYIFGQIYDYMLRLRTFHGLKHVFGIVSTYEQWRLFWLEDCCDAAISTVLPSNNPDSAASNSFSSSPSVQAPYSLPHLIPVSALLTSASASSSFSSPTPISCSASGNDTKDDPPSEEGKEEEQEDAESDEAELIESSKLDDATRILCGTAIIEWNHRNLPLILCSVLHKMAASPVSQVQLVDPMRPYIIIDSNQWYWATVYFNSGCTSRHSFLNYSKMPTRKANKFILLRDLHGGADGRVWMVCTEAGLVGVLKFGQFRERETDLAAVKARLEQEAKIWVTVWKQPHVRVISLAGDYALLMPYIEPIPLEVNHSPIRSPLLDSAVHSAVQQMAVAGYCHLDLHWRHVGILPTQQTSKSNKKTQKPISSPSIILFDLARVKRSSMVEIEASVCQIFIIR